MNTTKLLVTAAILLLAACASTPHDALRQYLDEDVVAVVTGTTAPLVLARERPALAAHARDYLYLGPLEINRQGALGYYLWLGTWSTLASDEDTATQARFDEVFLFVDGEPMELESARTRMPRFYATPVRTATSFYYAVTLDQLRRLADASEVYAVSGTDPHARYDRWDWNGTALSAFVDYGRDRQLR